MWKGRKDAHQWVNQRRFSEDARMAPNAFMPPTPQLSATTKDHLDLSSRLHPPQQAPTTLQTWDKSETPPTKKCMTGSSSNPFRQKGCASPVLGARNLTVVMRRLDACCWTTHVVSLQSRRVNAHAASTQQVLHLWVHYSGNWALEDGLLL